MIVVLVSAPKFEYDIHSLVKAFYPKEDVKVIADQESVSDVSYTFKVSFDEQKISFFDEKGNLLSTVENPANSERVKEKNNVKKLIYDALSKKEGRTLVWGDLTGIRPTKIPRKLLEEGKSDSEILKYMQDTYFVSDEKANLSIDIAKREIEILRPLREKGYSIYIGIPFCPTTCLYCSFTSNPIAMWRDRVSDYLSALEKEIKFVSEKRKGKTIDTIYIGGGTPTTLNASELDRLLTMIDDNLDVSKLLEYTVEAGRADSITLDKLKVLKAHNVTRISVNPQTMNQKTLDIIGRRHTVEDVIRAFYDARSEGFSNINMDRFKYNWVL